MRECNPEICKIKGQQCLVFIDEIDEVGLAEHLCAYGTGEPVCNQSCPLGKFHCTRTSRHEGTIHETHGNDDPDTAHARWIDE